MFRNRFYSIQRTDMHKEEVKNYLNTIVCGPVEVCIVNITFR